MSETEITSVQIAQVKLLYLDSIQSVLIRYNIEQEKLTQKVFQRQKYITNAILTETDSITNHYRMLMHENKCKLEYIKDSLESYKEMKLYEIRVGGEYNRERIFYNYAHKADLNKLVHKMKRDKVRFAEEQKIKDKYDDIKQRENTNEFIEDENAKIKQRAFEKQADIDNADALKRQAEMLVKASTNEYYNTLMRLNMQLIQDGHLQPSDSMYLVTQANAKYIK